MFYLSGADCLDDSSAAAGDPPALLWTEAEMYYQNNLPTHLGMKLKC
jgi:hypothetical protein